MDLHSPVYPFSSARNAVYAKNGMVATSQPLAAQAGLSILQQGGNAVDAAIATAAALTVVEPTSNGIGGDAFAIVWMKDQLHGLNSSGKSVKNLTAKMLKEQGHSEMPCYGWEPVTVPGVPSAWAALSERWGNLSLLECLVPAIEYAKHGYPLSPTLAKYWKKAVEKFNKIRIDQPELPLSSWFDTFTKDGVAPQLGDVWKLEGHARTLREIGETDAKSFYYGDLAKKIVEYSDKTGGYFTLDDLSKHEVEWITPVSLNYRGYDFCEIPPNGQGIIALMAMNIANNHEYNKTRNELDLHLQIESMKLAFADGLHYITDPADMDLSTDDLLSVSYGQSQAKKISHKAQVFTHDNPKSSGTVYLATADKDGNMVSYIQSNYMGFGSGLVVPETGISLQNRGHNFSLNENDANYLKPEKKTLHTIIPGFIMKDGQPIGPFGVMGGFMQPQGHFQVAMNLIDYKLNPQSALDAPRWQWMKEKTVLVEQSLDNHSILSLLQRGHDIKIEAESGVFGRGQIIVKDPETGVLIGGTEGRTDGAVASY
ncbi:gamma-glutamyltransferase family protein [Vibrio sp. SS-MA-C1-2]|uniref:gamma-glutamyltransferase family protein n=1 Tax=Vibrio sp. SS-MA-C1-2 TaxID=2908646 RepID=UPI001F2583E9|nr:gamma-glutamyltransferase family protein [Vibrio sp. SS-MA-C1-2]UJF17898.1 gamma-glutamyltransferase family protein [Vibrio sp. SS-MA-C1-2]